MLSGKKAALSEAGQALKNGMNLKEEQGALGTESSIAFVGAEDEVVNLRDASSSRGINDTQAHSLACAACSSL
jgi:hypothetical protein